jgi:hypothetical protein
MAVKHPVRNRRGYREPPAARVAPTALPRRAFGAGLAMASRISFIRHRKFASSALLVYSFFGQGPRPAPSPPHDPGTFRDYYAWHQGNCFGCRCARLYRIASSGQDAPSYGSTAVTAWRLRYGGMPAQSLAGYVSKTIYFTLFNRRSGHLAGITLVREHADVSAGSNQMTPG